MDSLSLKQPALDCAPSWSWFANSIYSGVHPMYDGGLLHLSEARTFSARVLQYRWPDRLSNHSPPTAYCDFEGLQITIESATCITTVILRNEQFWQELCCESLETNFASLFGGNREEVNISCCPDDLKDHVQPPAIVCLALVFENFDGGDSGTDRKIFSFDGVVSQFKRLVLELAIGTN